MSKLLLDDWTWLAPHNTRMHKAGSLYAGLPVTCMMRAAGCYLQAPVSMSQTRAVLSSAAVMATGLLAATVTAVTRPECPSRTCSHSPDIAFQTLHMRNSHEHADSLSNACRDLPRRPTG